MLAPPKNRYEHIHVRLAVAILGHRHFWEGPTPLFYRIHGDIKRTAGRPESWWRRLFPISLDSEAWRVRAFARMSAAKDGRRQAHMDVLVAVLAKAHTRRATP